MVNKTRAEKKEMNYDQGVANVKKLLKKVFKEEIRNIEYKGETSGRNNVFRVQTTSMGNLLVRLSDEESRHNTFLKEKWCADIAVANGVPTPEILVVGHSVIPYVYSIVKEVEGITATDYGGDHKKIWEQMGYYAQKFNSIDTQGYGLFFNWKSKQDVGFKTWVEYLRGYDIRIDRVISLYREHMDFSEKSMKMLEQFVSQVTNWEVFPKLTHFDYDLRNILVDDSGNINVILDWELARSLPAPHGEFSQVMYVHMENKTPEYLDAFFDGYGLNMSEIGAMLPEMEAYMLVRQANHLNFLVRENLGKGLQMYRDAISRMRCFN